VATELALGVKTRMRQGFPNFCQIGVGEYSRISNSVAVQSDARKTKATGTKSRPHKSKQYR